MDTTPETVTEAVEYLASLGYTDEISVHPDGLAHPGRSGRHPLDTAIVDHRYRFEGPSDPADEAIVFGISCAGWDGLKGVIVTAFGPNADPDETAALRALSHRPAD